MLEKSVVSVSEIQSLLEEKYSLSEIDSISSLTGGSANCYHVKSVSGEYVLKEFQSKYSTDDLRHEPRVNMYLGRHDIPVARFFKTSSGEFLWEHKQHAFHLQEYIEDFVFAPNTAPEWLMAHQPVLLGRIHSILGGYSGRLSIGFGREWYEWDTCKCLDKYERLLVLARELSPSLTRDRIVDDLQYRLDLLPKIVQFSIDRHRLSYSASHGDYSILQLICGSGEIRGVIDFSASCCLPVVWEIIRSYTYSDPKCSEGRIDVRNLKDYLASYLGVWALSGYDVGMMPLLYLVQLVRSQFGYRQYLMQSSENREDLLQFAFWRTNMCRWLEEMPDTCLTSVLNC